MNDFKSQHVVDWKKSSEKLHSFILICDIILFKKIVGVFFKKEKKKMKLISYVIHNPPG